MGSSSALIESPASWWDSLAENFRLVVMLYYIEGFKTSEISQILDIPEGTVRSRLARGREQLAGLLQLKVVN